MAFIRTIRGDIAPEDSGVCDFHDHLIRTGGATGPEVLGSLKDAGVADGDIRAFRKDNPARTFSFREGAPS